MQEKERLDILQSIAEDTNSSLRTPKSRNRILLVDDEVDITFTFKRGLEDDGFEVDSFNDPQTALSKFRADIYDIALIDIKMPQMNGFDLYRKLRKIDDKIKYCFMTAYELYYETLKKDYPTLNVGCFIKKPIEIGDLIKELRSELES
jgi:two-component system, OmpR family, response regulator ChvI